MKDIRASTIECVAPLEATVTEWAALQLHLKADMTTTAALDSQYMLMLPLLTDWVQWRTGQ